jgi:hypothetical protein
MSFLNANYSKNITALNKKKNFLHRLMLGLQRLLLSRLSFFGRKKFSLEIVDTHRFDQSRKDVQK